MRYLPRDKLWEKIAHACVWMPDKKDFLPNMTFGEHYKDKKEHFMRANLAAEVPMKQQQEILAKKTID